MKKLPWMMTLSLCAACSSTPKMTDTEDTATTASSESGQETGLSSGEENSTSTDTTGELPACAGEDENTRLIFVTSWFFSGSLQPVSSGADIPLDIEILSGLARADAICQYLAEKAHLKGCFKAWLSDEFEGAAERLGLTGYAGEFVNTMGESIASTWEGLIGGDELQHAIQYDENGEGAGLGVWTHTNPDGTSVGGQPPCSNWTSGSGVVVVGNASQVSSAWTDKGFGLCGQGRRIYCMQTN